MLASAPSDIAPASQSAFSLARPILWLAAIAFLLGFIGYLVLAAPVMAYSSHGATARTISGPVSDDWNIRKAI